MSDLQPIKAGVPQGSVLGPTLYTLFTADLPTSSNTTLGTFAADIAILSVHEEPDIAASNLQHYLSALQNYFEKWCIKINANKSCYIIFTFHKRPTPDVCISGTQISHKTEIKYLGMIMESKLTWKEHVVKKRKPIWMYGLELWGCASKSNTSIVQRSQSKILRMIVDEPWYICNATLHADLGLSSIQDVIQQRSSKHHNKIKTHENPLLKMLLARDDNRQLKRNWPVDLI
jgi:hypothetical protein